MLPNQVLGVATTALFVGVVSGWALFSRNKKVVHIHHHYPVQAEETEYDDSDDYAEEYEGANAESHSEEDCDDHVLG